MIFDIVWVAKFPTCNKKAGIYSNNLRSEATCNAKKAWIHGPWSQISGDGFSFTLALVDFKLCSKMQWKVSKFGQNHHNIKRKFVHNDLGWCSGILIFTVLESPGPLLSQGMLGFSGAFFDPLDPSLPAFWPLGIPIVSEKLTFIEIYYPGRNLTK